MDISGIIGVSLTHALQRSSVQGNDQADVDGLTQEIIAQQSRSHQSAVAGERVSFLFGLEAKNKPWR
jgi:hypothetical protein